MVGTPVVLNSVFFTQHISFFIEYYLKPLKLVSLPPLLDDVILCAIGVVRLYPNIPHDEWLIAMRKALALRKDKRISTESLTEFVECVLKNNIFERNLSFYKQLKETVISTKMVPLYAIIFLGDLEERFLVIVTFNL